MKRNHATAGLLLLIGMGFALLGQFYFACRREYVWDGLFFWSLAILAFGLILWRTRWRQRRRPIRRCLILARRRPWRTLLALTGISLAWLVGRLAQQRPGTAGFADLLWLWLIGIALFLLAFLPSFSVKDAYPHLFHWFLNRRRELAGLAALLLIALLLRTVDLEHIPANLSGDEGTQGMAALELLEPPLGNPFSTGWFSVPTMSFLAYGLAMRLFGESVAGLRALSAFIGALTVLTTFLLAQELWGRRVAWPAAILLTCSHFHIHFSRLGSNQISDGLFITLALWLLVRGLRLEKEIHFALAGAVMGFSWYGYFGARLIGIIVMLYLGWRLALQFLSPSITAAATAVGEISTMPPISARDGRRLFILLAAALIVAAPLLLHFAHHPSTLAARFNQVNIFTSGWMAREQAITGRSAASLLLEQFWKAISAFNYTLDSTFWYRPSIPLLDFIGGILFILGMAWVTARSLQPANGLLLIWFWSALILGWVLTENPPSSMRLINIAPALALLASLGLNWLTRLLRRLFYPPGVRYIKSFCYALFVSIAILNLWYYFILYTPTRVYGNPTAEVATELGRHLARSNDVQPCSIVYFYAPPVMYWDFGTLRFIARGVEGVNVPPIGQESHFNLRELDIQSYQTACFLFLPERVKELETVRTHYPGGTESVVYSDADGRLLYVLYEVNH